MDDNPQQPQSGRPFEIPSPAQPSASPHQMRREQQHRKKMLLFGIGGAVIMAALLTGVYFLFLRGDGQQPVQQTANTGTEERPSNEQQPAEQPAATDSTLQTYKSDRLGVELTHRADWTLKESDDVGITITSPQISYTGSGGQSKTGVFTVRIRKGSAQAQQTTINKSVAVKDSEVIAYAAPTQTQRQYTTLSYLGTAKDTFGFFIVTSNTSFKAGDPLNYALQFSSDSYLIVGGYGADAAGSLSFDPVPKASMNSDTLQEAIKIVKSLKIY